VAKKSIILFTRWFPYNKEKEFSFLNAELKILSQRFDEVYVVPQKIEGNYHQLPSNFIVDTSLAKSLESSSFNDKLSTLSSVLLFKELLAVKFSFSKCKRALSTLLSAIIVKRWLLSFLKEINSNTDVTLYSFWMDFSTLGCTLLDKQDIRIKRVSRCHNFDLYGNEDNEFYVPFQKYISYSLNAIFPDSQNGVDYLNLKFPGINCQPGIMGIEDVKFTNPGSSDNVFRIVSCSYMIPRKRVDLFLEGLIECSKNNKGVEIEWYHIGKGPMYDQIHERSLGVSENIKVVFKGNLSTEELNSFYINTPLDLFVNTSTKEGTPVSLMEAICFSIPVLVTAFGGNKEIVDGGAGFLLSENPTKQEIADKLTKIINYDNMVELKKASRKVWNDSYNSNKNYDKFCDDILAL
jgi:colanic acid/amylovoran biosynthesis glycosyltransferase